jgi:hypothetical protein
MATFLTTAKMNPALAERIETSVTGRPQSARRRRRRLTVVARLVAVVAVAYAIYGVLAARKHAQQELDDARGRLASEIEAQAADLGEDDRAVATGRFVSWLGRLAGAYEGDLVDGSLRGPHALSRLLAQPTVYVRGPIAAFGGSLEVLQATAATSGKDALLLCLVEPPASRSEKALYDEARAAYSGGLSLEQRTASVRRLNDAFSGLPLLDPAFMASVHGAPTVAEVARLRRDFERAPVARGKDAARASLLLAALDEPGTGTGPTELDGERPHAVRIGVIDLPSGRVLLRLRMPVDPSWISANRRATYASGLDSCALAFDLDGRLR